ncbi:MAG: protein N-terminal glutamine amidohydrolase [Planctomycetes bacterium]|nr:protein N-terminal glutamine amidohydrolase [Planctomycetota bacterium]
MANPPLGPESFTADWRARQLYQPFFCEENVWQLLAGTALPASAAAVFVTNAKRTVAMWGQRAAARDPIVWDYHVVALLPHERLIVDLDDRDRCAHRLEAWLERAFRRSSAAELQPRFRIVPRAEFLAEFASDRSHMRGPDGSEREPFPSWPPPRGRAGGSNLARCLDLDDPIAGVVTDRDGLLRWPVTGSGSTPIRP